MNDIANNLLKVAEGEGQHFSVAGATLTWKVRSEQSGGGFCFFEQLLAPGEGVPLHTHSYPEAFYILTGMVIFASGQDLEGATHCTAGDVVLARPHTKHSFYNPGPDQVKMLSISTGAHEAFFDAVQEADQSAPFSAMAPEQAMARIAAIGAETDTNFCISPSPSPTVPEEAYV